MTTKAHKNLTGTDLHENKGASSASDDYVATVTSGATVWKKLTASNLTGTGNPFGGQLYHIREQRASGTSSTYSPSASTWNTVPLNTELTTEISGASLASSQITLPAGTFHIEAVIEVFGVNRQPKARIRNITDGATLVVGINQRSRGSDGYSTGVSNPAMARGRFTLASSKVVEFQVYNDNGPAQAVSSGEVEVYGDVLIWKVA